MWDWFKHFNAVEKAIKDTGTQGRVFTNSNRKIRKKKKPLMDPCHFEYLVELIDTRPFSYRREIAEYIQNKTGKR
jgi:hypothetical protein